MRMIQSLSFELIVSKKRNVIGKNDEVNELECG
jgi:hypothetical protein